MLPCGLGGRRRPGQGCPRGVGPSQSGLFPREALCTLCVSQQMLSAVLGRRLAWRGWVLWCLTWWETVPKRGPLPQRAATCWLQRRDLTTLVCAGSRFLSASSLGKCFFFRSCKIDVRLPRELQSLAKCVFCERVHL